MGASSAERNAPSSIVEEIRYPGVVLPGRNIVQQVARPLALDVPVDEEAVVGARLDEESLVPGVVVVIGPAALDEKVLAGVRKIKSALVEMLMIVERAGPKDEAEIVGSETGAEDGGPDIAEKTDGREARPRGLGT